MSKYDITNDKKDDFLQLIGDLGYSINQISENPYIVHVKGKTNTIRLNIHCTQNVKKINGIPYYWYGFRKSVLADVDYVTLLPIDFLGFYNIPRSIFLNNMHIFFQSQGKTSDYTFGLMAGEESIFGYSIERNINLGDFFGVVDPNELKSYGYTQPVLPGFPPLV